MQEMKGSEEQSCFLPISFDLESDERSLFGVEEADLENSEQEGNR